MKLKLGQIVVATKETGVCNVGERGIVYELYERKWDVSGTGKRQGWGGGIGASVIFEQGLYDGFSPDEQDAMLKPLDLFDEAAQAYRFTNVMRLVSDYHKRVFNFWPERGPHRQGEDNPA